MKVVFERRHAELPREPRDFQCVLVFQNLRREKKVDHRTRLAQLFELTERVGIERHLVFGFFGFVGLPHVGAGLHESPGCDSVGSGAACFGLELIAYPAMAAEMDFRINDPRNKHTSFKIDDLSCFRGYLPLPNSDDLFPVYGNKSFNNLSLSDDLTVLEQNLDLIHCCSPKFTLIPS